MSQALENSFCPRGVQAILCHCLLSSLNHWPPRGNRLPAYSPPVNIYRKGFSRAGKRAARISNGAQNRFSLPKVTSLSFPPKVLPKLPQMGRQGGTRSLLGSSSEASGVSILFCLYHPEELPWPTVPLESSSPCSLFCCSLKIRHDLFLVRLFPLFSDFELGVPRVSDTCSSLHEKQSLRA